MADRTATINSPEITLFTWGYWGWGTSTQRLVQAVDAAEKQRGFKPPIFVDIRLQRSVRAPGFSGDAFKRVVGRARYRWMPELGNRDIATGGSGIHIDKPVFARDLLQLAIDSARANRRLLFFCSCKDVDVRSCHRKKVADLLLREAARRHRRIAVVEWPGNTPTCAKVAVTPSILKAVRGGRKNVPLGRNVDLKKLAGLPWGSIAELDAGEQTLPIVSGPLKYRRGWCLPVFRCGKPNSDCDRLKPWGEMFRKQKELESRC